MADRASKSPEEPLASWARTTEVVEIPLLLPFWQVSALEQAAHQRGMTAAEMVRGLLRDFIAQQPELGTEAVLCQQSDSPVL